MTVIAYRSGVMASDTKVGICANLKIHQGDKVFKRKGHLFGIAGSDCPSNDNFLKWFFGNRDDMSEFEFEALVVVSDGCMFLIDQRGSEYPIDQEFFALGSGQEVAMGAMEMGATAVQAVEAAIRWAAQCEGEVTSISL